MGIHSVDILIDALCYINTSIPIIHFFVTLIIFAFTGFRICKNRWKFNLITKRHILKYL